MAFELINHAQVTPHRLRVAVQLVARLGQPTREELQALLQPESLTNSQLAATSVLTAAQYCRLVSVTSDRYSLLVDPDVAESVDAFRLHLQGNILGVTNESGPNYLFNLFSAWYAVQNESVYNMEQGQYHVTFNEQLFPGSSERAFNREKLPAWSNWAAFLGLCWPLRVGGSQQRMIPNAYRRLKPIMRDLLPMDGAYVPFGTFFSKVATTCPELDGGSLFEQSWNASRGHTARSSLSLMLSSGLRQLHDARVIELLRRPDANQNFNLYRIEGHNLQQVSHIRLRVN